MPRKVGYRVGAVFGSVKETKTLEFLGYGTYMGDEIPVDAGGWMADAIRESKTTNPKIVLDNGDVVWGCECWWGNEAEVKAALARHAADGWTVAEVRIADLRTRAREAAEAQASKDTA